LSKCADISKIYDKPIALKLYGERRCVVGEGGVEGKLFISALLNLLIFESHEYICLLKDYNF
jgi:hypothetical protein